MEQNSVWRIGIVGGGPAGLASAIAARLAGFDVTVYEQAAGFERVGGAIGVQSNGLRVLDALGVLPGLQPRIELLREAVLESPPGRNVTRGDFRELTIPHSHFAVAPRYDLQEVLLGAALDRGANVVFGRRCVSASAGDRQVTLSFSDGSTACADLVFACDGNRSAVRETGGFRSHRRVIGEAYLRMVAPIAHPTPERIGEYWAIDGRRAGAFPLPHDRTYVFCSVPIGRWSEIRARGLTRWIDGWRDFGDPVYPLMCSIDDWDSAVYDELTDLRVDRWYGERLILLGDAAHAMTPNLGQGANSAMVDGLVLVNLLLEAAVRGDWREAARRYQRLRKPFVTRLQRIALTGGRVAGWRSAPARGLRDDTMRLLNGIGPMRRAALRLTAGYNPAEDAYLCRPVPVGRP